MQKSDKNVWQSAKIADSLPFLVENIWQEKSLTYLPINFYLCAFMGIRASLIRPFSAWVVNRQKQWIDRPLQHQEKVFRSIVQTAAGTRFGRDHGFGDIRRYDDFRKQVPIRDYEGLSPYINSILAGEKDVLWPGKPLYFAKTSGTTSGTKYIPLTRESMPNHIQSARNAIMSYVHESGNAAVFDGKLIFLQGSPVLGTKAGIHTGRLSGIVNHHVPFFYRINQMPSYSTNCIEDWEEKVERIIDETLVQNMTLISGIPPWVQMYFDRIIQRTGKKIMEVFPEFSLFIYGGVNFEPYRARIYDSIGKKIDSIETYPASEGFIAYQDTLHEEGLLLVLNSGIFFEFIPVEEYFGDDPRRLSLEEVELGKNYALVINSNAGLWGYSIGDTVKFVNKDPYRIVVSGRIKHYISAFGEHVIGEEVEKALKHAMQQFPEVGVIEFTVAPQVNPQSGLPLHEWYIEFAAPPYDLHAFEKVIDEQLQTLNSYYKDLIQGRILRPLSIKPLCGHAFREYMKDLGKLGGQNKVPRLANDRTIADSLYKYVL